MPINYNQNYNQKIRNQRSVPNALVSTRPGMGSKTLGKATGGFRSMRRTSTAPFSTIRSGSRKMSFGGRKGGRGASPKRNSRPKRPTGMAGYGGQGRESLRPKMSTGRLNVQIQPVVGGYGGYGGSGYRQGGLVRNMKKGGRAKPASRQVSKGGRRMARGSSRGKR